MSSTTGQPRNRRYIRVPQQRKTKLRWPENGRAPKRTQGVQQQLQQCEYIHTCVYKRGRFPRVWATEWDVFLCTPSRGGRGRRAAVDIFRGVFFECLVGFPFFLRFLYFERTRPTASTRQPCLMHLSTSIEARPRERSDRGRFLPIGKKAFSYRGAYRVPLFN